jgi:hypothetical protein
MRTLILLLTLLLAAPSFAGDPRTGLVPLGYDPATVDNWGEGAGSPVGVRVCAHPQCGYIDTTPEPDVVWLNADGDGGTDGWVPLNDNGRYQFKWREEFCTAVFSTIYMAGENNWFYQGTGGTAGDQALAGTYCNGYFQAGASAGNWVTLKLTPNNAMSFPNGMIVRWNTRVNTVSSANGGADEFDWLAGVCDLDYSFASTCANGIYFIVDVDGSQSAAASPNWQFCTETATVQSCITTSVPPVGVTYQRFEFRIASDRSSVEGFIDGVSIGSIATNIPPASTFNSLAAFIKKETATAARWMSFDYWEMIGPALATPR